MVVATGPSLQPRIEFVNLDRFLIELEEFGEPIAGGVGVFGPAAAYALVWEYGSDTAEYPGPKTVWGVNPLGERAIMSRQAPEGYISIHEHEIWPMLVAELSKVNWDAKSSTELRLRLEVAIDNASQQVAQLISDSAPVDSGDLRAGIQLIDSGSDLLDSADLAASEGNSTFFF